jgi:hypothetical protein
VFKSIDVAGGAMNCESITRLKNRVAGGTNEVLPSLDRGDENAARKKR